MREEELITLQSYLDNELPPAERLAFEAELATRPDLQAELAEWQTLFASIGELEELEIEFDVAEVVVAELERGAEVSNRWRFWVWVQVGMSALLLILGWPILSTLVVFDEPIEFSFSDLIAAQLLSWQLQLQTVQAEIEFVIEQLNQIDPNMTLSLAVLLPIAAVMAVLWVISTRAVLNTQDWRPTV